MFAQIILAVDGSELSLEAIRQAHGLGLLDSAELHVLAAFDSASVTLGGLLDLSRERMDALHDEVVRTCLDPAEALLEELGLNAASRRMIHSDPVQGLVDEAKRVKAELLVCGRRGFGAVRRLFTGSTSLRLLQMAPCPVLVVPAGLKLDEQAEGPPRVVLPTDFSRLSEAGVDVGVEVARSIGAEVHLVHCVSPFEIFPIGGQPHGDFVQEELDRLWDYAHNRLDARATALIESGLKAKPLVRRADPVEGVIEAAEQARAGLIVTSSHGRRGIERFWLGSTAEGIVQKATTPVLVVRQTSES